MDKIKNKPKIIEGNMLYLIITILLLTVGSLAQQRDMFSGLLITEYIITLAPILLYLKIKGYNFKEVLRLNKLTIKEVFLIPAITLLAYPVGAFLNLLMMIIISTFGEIVEPPLPTPSSGGIYLIGLFVIAITPGICEEVMFRGFIMKTYDSKGYKKAIFISGILFGLMHFNLQNLLGPIFLGVLFGFMVYRTNSLFAGIIGHITNNGFAWTLTYFVTKSGVDIEQAEEVSIEISETMSMMMGAIFLLGIALFTSILAYKLYKKLPDRQAQNLDNENEIESVYNTGKGEEKIIKGTLKYIPIIIIVLIYIYLHILAYF